MIRLVPARPEHADFWQRWAAEPATLKYNPVLPLTPEQRRERVTRARSDLSDLEAAEEFLLFVESEGRPVGTVSLKNISHMMAYGEIGYGIGQDHQGRGIGTEAVRLFTAKIFAETSLRRLVAYVAEGNAASCRLLEKVGFRREGLCREHYLIQGVPTNEAYYGLLRSEFRPG